MSCRSSPRSRSLISACTTHELLLLQQKKRAKADGKNKENLHDAEAPELEEVQSPSPTGGKPCYDVKHSEIMGR